MTFSDSLIGRIIITALGGILGTILGIIIIGLLLYLFIIHGVIPFAETKAPDFIKKIFEVIQ